MIRLRLLTFAFTLVTLIPLPLWLLANWFSWSMADFDCADGYWECRRHLVLPTVGGVGLALAAWGLLAWWLAREWKKY